MLKRILISVLTGAVMFTSLAGCSGDKNNTSDSASESFDKNDFSNPVTISMNVIYTDKNNNDKRYDYLKEKFNIEFELIACSLNDIKEKTRIWVAGGDMPEVMWSDMALTNASELKSWAESGVFREFPDVADYPNLAAVKESIPSYDVLKVDGKDYYWLGGRGMDGLNGIGPEVYLYRKDWAKELGFYKEEYTWEEMLELAQAFIEKDPGGNGAGKTIGMAAIGWAYPDCSGVRAMSPQSSNFVLKDGEYVWAAEFPETLEGIKMAKRMYDEGIFWSEQTLAENFDGPSRFQAGQVGILYHNCFANNVLSTVDGFKKANPDIDVSEAIGVMNVKSPDGTYYRKKIVEWWGTTSFRADIDEEKMYRFLAMHEWLNSEEGLDLRTYGIEGEDYKKNGDEYELLWEQNENGIYVSPYETESDRIMNMFQLTEDRNYVSETVPEDTRGLMQEVLDFCNKTENVVINETEVDVDILTFSAPTKDKYNITEDFRTKVMELIVNSSDIEKDYKAWLETMQAKVQPILKELNEGLK